MKPKSTAKSVSPRTALGTIGALVFLIAAAFLVVQQVNFLVGRSLLVVFGNADSTYKGAWFELDGDLVAKDFAIASEDPAEGVLLSFERVHVETPGWGWVLGTMLDKEKLISDLDHLRITLTGGTSGFGLDPTLGDLGPFGTDSASPFEAEGCLQDNLWVRSELIEMGLSPGATTLEYDYRLTAPDALATTITLATPGVSRVVLERQETVPAGANPFLLDVTQTLTTSERWSVQDEGFVKARNAFCAKKDGIDAAQFVARHVAAVQRQLATRGLGLDPTSAAMYADFAANGGALSFGGTYPVPVPSEVFYEIRDSGRLGDVMEAVVGRDAARLPVQWSRFAPAPLAGQEEGVTTYEAMLKEGFVIDTAAVPVPAAAVTPAATPATAAPEPVAVALTASAPVLSASGRRITASSLPAKATSLESRLARGTEVPWADLGQFIGHDMEIHTGRSPPRVVTLQEASPTEVRVEATVQGGHVEYRINREAFLRAVFIR